MVSNCSVLPFASKGISKFQLKCDSDLVSKHSEINFFGKIDNSKSQDKIKKIEVRLERVIKLATQAYHINPVNMQSSYDITLKETLFKDKYEGINKGDYDRNFDRKFSIDLEKVF